MKWKHEKPLTHKEDMVGALLRECLGRAIALETFSAFLAQIVLGLHVS